MASDTESSAPASPALATSKKVKSAVKPKTKAPKAKNEEKKVASHPLSTADMIIKAITQLAEKKGSSLFAIKKVIAETFKVDVKKKAIYIRSALKKLVAAGQLIQPGSSDYFRGKYRLADAPEGFVYKEPEAKKAAKLWKPLGRPRKLGSREPVAKPQPQRPAGTPMKHGSTKTKTPKMAPSRATGRTKKAAETTKKAVGTPEKAAQTPKGATGTTKKASETLKKAAETPKRATGTPKKAAETPKKAVGTPEKAAQTPKRATRTQKKAAETPKRATGTPKKASETPKKAVGTPKKAVVIPRKAAETPEMMAETPKKAAATPVSRKAATRKRAAPPKSPIPNASKVRLPRTLKPMAATPTTKPSRRAAPKRK